MIYTFITGDNTLLFFDGRHAIASINFKSEYKLYKYLKMCVTFIDCSFDELVDNNDINYSSLTDDDITLISEKYDNMLYEFNEHILKIERG